MTNTTSEGSRIFPGTLQNIDSATFTGSYQTLATLAFPARIFKITNNSNVDVTVSWNATNDHEFVPAKGFVLIDCAANHQTSGIFSIPKGTVISVKGAAGIGLVYLSYYYAVSS